MENKYSPKILVNDVKKDVNLDKTVQNVVKLLLLREIQISFAESCTGGLLSEALTSVAGVAPVYELGICSYADEIKNKILGVPQEELVKYTAVSEQVAASMVKGIRKLSGAEICISVTGIAGPGGGTKETPVGTVYIGEYLGSMLRVRKLTELYSLENKSRESIRYNTALIAFSEVLEFLSNERLMQESGIIK